MANGNFGGGDGSGLSPFLVEDAHDLNAIRNDLTAYYLQVNNINLDIHPYNQSYGWQPIGGNGEDSFSGSYNGNYLTISNMEIINDDDRGLFNIGLFGSTTISSIVSKLKVVNSSIQNTGSSTTYNVGGVIGHSASILIEELLFIGDISSRGNVGGVIGYIPGSSGSTKVVRKLISKCDIYGNNVVGGIIGYCDSGVRGDIVVQDSYSKGNLIGIGEVGGIVGRCRNHRDTFTPLSTVTIRRCYSNCSLTSNDCAGGISGKVTYTGGSLGDNNPVYIQNCFSVGNYIKCNIDFGKTSIDNKIESGKIAGKTSTRQATFSLSNCYARDSMMYIRYNAIQKDFFFSTDNFHGISISENMLNESQTYIDASWNFIDTWELVIHESLPNLKWYPDTEVLQEGVYTTEENPFAGGIGSPNDPYLVANAEQLNNIRNFKHRFFKQVADIDLNIPPYNQGEGWIPIGDEDDKFYGGYNGDFHKISNLYINTNKKYVGLFGDAVNFYCENLIMKSVDINSSHGEAYIGSICGRAYVLGGISKIYVDGNISGNLNGLGSTGGVLGRFFNVNITRSISQCISFVNVSGGNKVGGILGEGIAKYPRWWVTGTVNISNSFSYGSIYGNSMVGGIAGFVEGDDYSIGFNTWSYSRLDFYRCYTVSAIHGYEFMAGIVGHNHVRSKVWYSYSLCPYILSYLSTSLNSIMNSRFDGTMPNSYGEGNYFFENVKRYRAFMTLSPPTNVGNNPTGYALSFNDIRSKSTYENTFWDFESVWNIDEGSSTPYLRWYRDGHNTLPYSMRYKNNPQNSTNLILNMTLNMWAMPTNLPKLDDKAEHIKTSRDLYEPLGISYEIPSNLFRYFSVLDQDDFYIYASSVFSTGGSGGIRKYLKSNNAFIGETVSMGAEVHSMGVDDNYIYCIRSSPDILYKFNKNTLDVVSFSDLTVSLSIKNRRIVMDNDFLYLFGGNFLYKYSKSTLAIVDTYPDYGGEIFTAACDDEFVYVGGATVRRILQYDKESLELVKTYALTSDFRTPNSILLVGDDIYEGTTRTGFNNSYIRRLNKNNTTTSIIAYMNADITWLELNEYFLFIISSNGRVRGLYLPANFLASELSGYRVYAALTVSNNNHNSLHLAFAQSPTYGARGVNVLEAKGF